MKCLATIKSVRVGRVYQRKDGSMANVYSIAIESGDDTLLAESFYTRDGLERRGVVAGAIGTATIDLGVRVWTDRDGKEREMQTVQLRDFALANRNIERVERKPATEDDDTTALPVAEKATESTGEAESAKNNAVSASKQADDNSPDLPF